MQRSVSGRSLKDECCRNEERTTSEEDVLHYNDEETELKVMDLFGTSNIGIDRSMKLRQELLDFCGRKTISEDVLHDNDEETELGGRDHFRTSYIGIGRSIMN
ncbi:hypothetical protein ABFS82_13G098100 [Erythranthe guttata]